MSGRDLRGVVRCEGWSEGKFGDDSFGWIKGRGRGKGGSLHGLFTIRQIIIIISTKTGIYCTGPNYNFNITHSKDLGIGVAQPTTLSSPAQSG